MFVMAGSVGWLLRHVVAGVDHQVSAGQCVRCLPGHMQLPAQCRQAALLMCHGQVVHRHTASFCLQTPYATCTYT